MLRDTCRARGRSLVAGIYRISTVQWALAVNVAASPCDRPASRTDRALETKFEKILEVTVTEGTIKKVVSDRGFGFITSSDQKDYFFHRNALDYSLDFDRLVGGEKVEFEIEQSPKGPRANNVRSAGAA